ncbi:glycosyltransferase family 8 protein [candidate division KSB1 bacterium]|nr:glycosyltransferase family 8 protein [candidate division KSB1 bacterium]
MIHICLSCDINYIQHMAVTMSSILYNEDDNRKLFFHVIHNGGLTEDIIKKINKLTSLKPFQLNTYCVDADFYKRLENVPVKGRFTETVLYRIMAPSILHDVSKIIYLDSDIVVTQNISGLWDMPMRNHSLAAIDNFPFPDHMSDVGIPREGPYFNSGVLVMDLELMRREETEGKAIDFVKKSGHLCRAPDQDVLNAVFYNAYLRLPPKYNARHLFFMPSFYLNKKLYHAVRQYYGDDDFNEAINSPIIIHYAGPSKPWHYENKNRLKSEYWKYLRMTPWSEYQFDMSWGKFVEKWTPESFKYYAWNLIMPGVLKKAIKKYALTNKN